MLIGIIVNLKAMINTFTALSLLLLTKYKMMLLILIKN